MTEKKTNKKWKTFDQVQNPPSFFDRDACKRCFYAREYKSEGYQSSDDNQLIFNFKKRITQKGKPEWVYKKKAIEQFANELHELFISSDKNRVYTVTTIPTSKSPDDINYDCRFEEMITHLTNYDDINICYEKPIILKESVKSVSAEGGERNPALIYTNYKFKGFKNNTPKMLCVIDDVVTSGAHFVAYRDLLLKKCPTIKIIGLFWARTIQT